jgi:hypothetical protein
VLRPRAPAHRTRPHLTYPPPAPAPTPHPASLHSPRSRMRTSVRDVAAAGRGGPSGRGRPPTKPRAPNGPDKRGARARSRGSRARVFAPGPDRAGSGDRGTVTGRGAGSPGPLTHLRHGRMCAREAVAAPGSPDAGLTAHWLQLWKAVPGRDVGGAGCSA